MGYAVYEVGERWGGYGVPAICEHPDCNEEIHRGLDYACGGNHSSEGGCDRYFCHKHLIIGDRHCFCEQCISGKDPFDYKPEHPEWVEHLLNDESWAKWREKNPEKVVALIPHKK